MPITATTASSAIAGLSNQSYLLPRSSTVWNEPTPTTSSAIPGQSTRPPRLRSRWGGSCRCAAHRVAAAIPSGTLIRKHQCQE